MKQDETLVIGGTDPIRIENSAQQSETALKKESLERTLAATEIGSAIAHQLNGPLTALRLYIGQIRDGSRAISAVQTNVVMQEMIEGAFRETERVCTLIGLLTDGFDGPMRLETAAARGRDAIGWWSRNGSKDGAIPIEGIDLADPPSIRELLTPREREVLDLVSRGLSNKGGALRMKIGPRTFESHRARIMRKLGARNAADLVRMVLGEMR
jgi:DNA-binding CsgD family transcriptional regulator